MSNDLFQGYGGPRGRPAYDEMLDGARGGGTSTMVVEVHITRLY